jgi:hypothetical protein
MMQTCPAARPIYDDAMELIGRFGPCALDEAASRAKRSRDAGNVLHFCHWRQTARTIAALISLEVVGTLH